jgi:signal transduction histidine kinase
MRLQLIARDYDELRANIDHAIDNVVALSQFNDEILQKNSTHTSRIDLKVLINDVETLCRDQIKASDAKIEVDNDIPPVYGVYQDVLRVFKNLVENSLKHANVRPLIIKIKPLTATRSSVSIMFADNGKPLSKDQKILIKHLLERSDGMNSRLGLGICSKMMRRINGTVRLLEENGQCSYELTFAVDDKDSNVTA